MPSKDKKTATPRIIPEGKTQVNFNIDNALLEKVKDLAHVEGVSNATIYNMAVSRFIEAYEKKNGKLKQRPKGKGLKDL